MTFLPLLCFADHFAALCDFSHTSSSDQRSLYFHTRIAPTSLVKHAFDSRRVNQNTDFNPRRNLQYYQRSEPYLSAQAAERVGLFFKVKEAADEIREKYIGEPDWLDSHTRILCNAVDQTLRIEQRDFDYSHTQLDYLSELLYVRYRLRPEDITNASRDQLRDIFLNKDERLLRRSVFVNYQRDLHKTSAPPTSKIEDTLTEKLFGGVKASKDNKSVKRSVNITISDSIDDESLTTTGTNLGQE